MRIGNTELLPDDNAVFDTTHVPASSSRAKEYQAITRFTCLNGGASGSTYRIYVDYQVTDTPMQFVLDNWTLKITRSHGCGTG